MDRSATTFDQFRRYRHWSLEPACPEHQSFVDGREVTMSLTSLGLVAAFGAGILSFLSPCVFPLVPGYLSYLAGMSLEEAQSKPTARWRVSLHALSFVLGFALIFTLLGATAALVGLALHTYQQWLARIAGGLLILFGIALTGLVPIPWLRNDYRVQMQPGRSVWWRSGLIG